MEIRVYLARNKSQAPPCIPVFVLGEGKTPLPSLSRDRAIALAQIILADEAKRRSPRGGHPKDPIRGKFTVYFGICLWRRGSDFVERVYAAVEILKHGGLTEIEACLEISAILGPRLGNSGRGKQRRRPKDDLHAAEVVRSLYNDFRNRHPWKEKLPAHDPIVEKWFSIALSISAWTEDVISAKVGLWRKYPVLAELLPLTQRIAAWTKNLRALTRLLHGRSAKRTMIGPRFARIPKHWQPSGILTFKDDEHTEIG